MFILFKFLIRITYFTHIVYFQGAWVCNASQIWQKLASMLHCHVLVRCVEKPVTVHYFWPTLFFFSFHKFIIEQFYILIFLFFEGHILHLFICVYTCVFFLLCLMMQHFTWSVAENGESVWWVRSSNVRVGSGEEWPLKLKDFQSYYSSTSSLM